jgi:TonB-linked SusC/RagA family outer membrane protein
MKKLLFLFFLSLSVAIINAQQRIVITGKVTDKTNLGLPGVTVIEKGTQNGTITDIDGNYRLQVPSESTLVFSFVGFQTVEMPVNGRTSISLQLIESILDIDEVVVIGYGTMTVKDLTSSITTLKSEELVKTPSGQAMQALQGKVAGLQIVSSGAPGSSPTVRVRGIGSYPGRNAESPLYVVDGMFFNNIDFINPSDIATISVLKDASAAAIYGVRAANGVIIIETKSGRYNQKSEIVYEGYYGYQVAQNVLKMANAEQYTNMALESGAAADASYILNAMQRYGRSRINPNVPDVNTDWYAEILRPASIQNHGLSFSGGSETAIYSIGVNYFGQEGILDMKNEFERFNIRSKVEFKANDWLTIGGSMIFSNALTYGAQSSAWGQAYFAVPILPVYDNENTAATPIRFASAKNLGYRGSQNPMPTMEYNHNRLKNRKLITNVYAQVEIIPKKLDFRSTYSHSFSTLNDRNVGLPYTIDDLSGRPLATINKSTSVYSEQSWDNILTYTNSADRHRYTVMAGTSFRDDAYEGLWASAIDFPYQNEESWYISQAANKPADGIGDGGMRQYGFSYLGRISYSYHDRYLTYATFRADGSSKYQEKWGYFPTVGLGWVVSEENFMRDNRIFDYLKVRASWGQLGNDKLPASDGASTTSVVYTAINDQRVAGHKTEDSFSWLKWEMTEETNIGITARMLNARLSVDADYYIRDTKNAVIGVSIPFTRITVMRNAGVFRNSGFELALDWSDRLANGLGYNFGANMATLKNEVKDLYGQPYLDGGSAEFRQRTIVGNPLLAFFGYEVVGVYQNQAQIDADPIAKANSLVPGDLRYKDQNSDKLIDGNDRVILGSYFPNFTYGFNAGTNYKNFELSVATFGQMGNKILNRKRGEIIWTNDLNMDADLAINRWHGEGTSDKYPSSAGLRKGWNQKMSNYFVEDGSFFRIQNVQVAYNINNLNFGGINLPDARVAFTAERPLTLFKYNGFNPEVANGIDMQTYPIPAVYTMGLNIKF